MALTALASKNNFRALSFIACVSREEFSLIRNRDTDLLAVLPDQDFDKVGYAAMVLHGGNPHCLLQDRVNTKIQGGGSHSFYRDDKLDHNVTQNDLHCIAEFSILFRVWSFAEGLRLKVIIKIHEEQEDPLRCSTCLDWPIYYWPIGI